MRRHWLWLSDRAAQWMSGLALGLLAVSCSRVAPAPPQSSDALAVEIYHPLEGAVFPQDMAAPVLLWKTNLAGVGRWAASFQAGGKRWSFEGVQRMWRPPEAEWRLIKQAAKEEPVELVLAGYAGENPSSVKATGSVRFTVSRDALVTALFYRDVNLPFSEAVKDPTTIRWRFGTVDQPTLPPVVLEKLPVCGNCHSFSRNAEYLGMDIDYANNKGSYVITRTAPEMKLATSDIITWDSFRREDGVPTLGLLSQISPDGRYVVSTVKDMSLFMAKPDLATTYLAVGDREQAIPALRETLRLNPACEPAQRALAELIQSTDGSRP